MLAAVLSHGDTALRLGRGSPLRGELGMRDVEEQRDVGAVSLLCCWLGSSHGDMGMQGVPLRGGAGHARRGEALRDDSAQGTPAQRTPSPSQTSGRACPPCSSRYRCAGRAFDSTHADEEGGSRTAWPLPGSNRRQPALHLSTLLLQTQLQYELTLWAAVQM